MSVQAITWVLEHAPDVPAHLVATLIGIANHADQDGCGAFPGEAVLAHYTRKSDRAVRKDLKALEELGLIRRGDQRIVMHVPADRRPVVWDLAMERTRGQRRPTRAASGRASGGNPGSGRSSQPGGTVVPAGEPTGGNCGSEPGGTVVPTNRPIEPSYPPPPTPSTAAAPAEHRDQEVVVEIPNQGQPPAPPAPRRSTDGPLPAAKRRAAERDAEAMAIVTSAQWPTAVPNPTGRRLLARTVRACLDRGHAPQAIQAAMTGSLDGARNPVAVAVARLRDLAAAAPEAQPARASRSRSERERLARTPHPYVATAARLCGACGRPEIARVHPDRQPNRSTRRCEHGRQPVACPSCRQDAHSVSPALA